MTIVDVIDVRQVDESLIRRIEAAVSHASVSRSAVDFDWPECHKRGCQGRHGSVDSAFGTMKIQVMRAVRSELQFEMTTRPDVADPEDTPEQVAVYALATLLHRYNVHDAGTYIKAAQLMVDAYPELVIALKGSGDE